MNYALILLAITLVLAWFIENRRRIRHTVGEGYQQDISLTHSQEFELYHNALSLCSMKTRVCLAECGIEYKSHHIDLIETGFYENIRSRFLSINPQGTVPVLVHNGHPIYQSHNQIGYISAHSCEQSLVPDNPQQIEEMQSWIDQTAIKDDQNILSAATAGHAIPGLTAPLFASMVKEIPLWKIGEGLLFHFDKRRPIAFIVMKVLGLGRFHMFKPAMNLHQLAFRKMQQHLDCLEQQIVKSGGPWILGEQFTLADVGWMPILERLEQVDVLHLLMSETNRAHCWGYWQALRLRPSYDSAIAKQRHATVMRGTLQLRNAKFNNAQLREALES